MTRLPELAFAVYQHRLRAAIASMAASMGGIDALVFTGGVGEHAPRVRREAADGLGFLGIGIDPDLNTAALPDCEIGSPMPRSGHSSSRLARISRSRERSDGCCAGRETQQRKQSRPDVQLPLHSK